MAHISLFPQYHRLALRHRLQAKIDRRVGRLQSAIADKDMPAMKRLVQEIEGFERQVRELDVQAPRAAE